MVKIPKKEKEKKADKSRVKEKYIVGLLPIILIALIGVYFLLTYESNYQDQYVFESPEGTYVPVDELEAFWYNQTYEEQEDISDDPIEDQVAVLEDQNEETINFSESEVFKDLLVENITADLTIQLVYEKNVGIPIYKQEVSVYVPNVLAPNGLMDSDLIEKIRHGRDSEWVWTYIGGYVLIPGKEGVEYYNELIEDVPSEIRGYYPSYEKVKDNYDIIKNEKDNYPEGNEDIDPFSLGWGYIDTHETTETDMYPVAYYWDKKYTYDKKKIGFITFKVNKEQIYHPSSTKVVRVPYTSSDINFEATDPQSNNDVTFAEACLYSSIEDSEVAVALIRHDEILDSHEFDTWFFGENLKYMDIGAVSDITTVLWFGEEDKRDSTGIGYWQSRPLVDLRAYDNAYSGQDSIIAVHDLTIPRNSDTEIRGIEIRITREYHKTIWQAQEGTYLGATPNTYYETKVYQNYVEVDQFKIAWKNYKTITVEEMQNWNTAHPDEAYIRVEYHERVGHDLGTFEIYIAGQKLSEDQYSIEGKSDPDILKESSYSQQKGFMKSVSLENVSLLAIIALGSFILILFFKKS